MWFRTTPLIMLVGMAFLQVDRGAAAQEVQLETYRLTPSDPGSTDMGLSLAICGDYIVAGATAGEAAVYVFQFVDGAWVERARLTGPGEDWYPGFGGLSLAIDGDVFVVGMSNASGTGSIFSARAFVFRRDDNGTPDDGADDVWNQEAKLVPLEHFRDDGFGSSVSISGNVIAVSAAGSGLTSVNRAYVFRWNGAAWIEEAVLVRSDTEDGDGFGVSVSVHGIVVIQMVA